MSETNPVISVDPAELAAKYDHHDPEQAQVIHSIYTAIRESSCPVARSEQHGGFWLATRYQDIDTMLMDPDTFSSQVVVIPSDIFGDFGFVKMPPVNLDGEEHRDFRRIVQAAFSAKVIHRWEGLTRSSCREFIDEFIESGNCDAAVDYAMRIPVRVVANMVGIPPEDEATFSSWLHRIVESGGGDPAGGLAAGAEMHEYFARQVAEHREAPRDDLLSILINAEDEGKRLTDEVLLGFLFIMVTAGMDTTWCLLADALHYLSEHPEQRAYLCEDFTRLPDAIEEFLRYFSPALIARYVARDTELGGTSLSEGDFVMMGFPAANRDGRAFEGADEVRLDRKPNRHLALGKGKHHCLGASLARMEIRIALEEWFRRIPDFEVPAGGSVRRGAGSVQGIKALPLVFNPGARTD